MSLKDEKTWPIQVRDYLDTYRDLFFDWESKKSSVSGPEYDRAIYGLRDVLKTDYVLQGYHCTRLTEPEIEHILANGMQVPDREMLCSRINALERAGVVEPGISERLKERNQADESSRAGKIWFCFYPPRLAGQGGIERLFRSWGGEALYNSHEDDPLSGSVLNKIGVPCIVEAYVPIAALPERCGLDFKIIRNYLVNRGLKTSEELDHEGYAEEPIPMKNIARVIRFPEKDFLRLTGCNRWKRRLV